MSLSESGVLSGTPSAHGQFELTVAATDAVDCPGTTGYSLLISPGAAITQPTITKVEPVSGPPGSLITLTGSGFSSVAANNTVLLNGMTAIVIAATPGQISAVIPSALQIGAASVVVTVNGRTSSPASFQVTAGATASVLLSAAKSGQNIALSWPGAPAGFELESTVTLDRPISWTRLPNSPVVIDGRNVVTVAPGGTTRFFRLISAGNGSGTAGESGVSTGQGTVIASTGGTVGTDDGTISLVIPPGALEQDTTIGITAVNVPSGGEHPSSGDVFLSPDGLKFSKPVNLRVQTPSNPPSGYRINVSLLSGAHTPREVGGEISYFEPITNFVFNSGSGQLEIPLNHFSAASWWYAKDLYAVLDIPGKFLGKGDLIYCLTGASGGQGGDWLPGHCGLYLGAESAFSGLNDGETIIESTQTRGFVDTIRNLSLGEVRFASLSFSTTSFKNLNGTHIYMGARRPLGFDLTDSQRFDVADWAIAQKGKPYAIIGGSAFLANEAPLYEGFTCVGLTELAYEFGVGKRVVPHQTARVLFTPFRQYQWTRPVDTAEISVDEEFNCNVIGAVNRGTFASNDYYTDEQYYTRALDLAACNDNARAVLDPKSKRAHFEPIPFGTFFFRPAASDAGKEFRFAFIVDATKSGAGIERATMTVRVKAFTTYRRVDRPFIQKSQLGNLSATNLVIEPSGLEASTTGRDSTTSRFRVSWNPPPATLGANSTFGMTIQSDVGSDNPQTANFSFGGPYLAADINQSAQFSADPAFAGYERTGNFSEHRLVQRPVFRTISSEGAPSVTVYLDMYRSAGPAGGGRVTGSVTWIYEPIE